MPTTHPEKIKDNTIAIKFTNVNGFLNGVGPIVIVKKMYKNLESAMMPTKSSPHPFQTQKIISLIFHSSHKKL